MIDVDILDVTPCCYVLDNWKHEELKYDMDIKNSDCLTGGPWNNTSICKKLHGKIFEEFIINARTDEGNIMCYIDAY